MPPQLQVAKTPELPNRGVTGGGGESPPGTNLAIWEPHGGEIADFLVYLFNVSPNVTIGDLFGSILGVLGSIFGHIVGHREGDIFGHPPCPDQPSGTHVVLGPRPSSWAEGMS